MEPHVKLAVAVVKQAVVDMNLIIKRMRKCEKRIASLSEADDERLEQEKSKLRLLQGSYDKLIIFFTSDWFEVLCDIMGMDSARVKELIVKSGKIAETEALNKVI